MITNNYLSPIRKEDIIDLAEIVAQNYQQETCINPELIAEDKGIKYCYGKYGDYFDGMLHYMNQRFFIFCNIDRVKNKASPRSRFTFSHELGHYFILEHRHALERGENLHHLSQTNFSSKILIEQEADLFAAYLLMPSFLFLPLLKRKKAKKGIKELLFLKEKFRTSITSTALRYIQSIDIPCAIIVWENSGKKRWYWTSNEFKILKFGSIVSNAKRLGRDSATCQVLFSTSSNIQQGGNTVTGFFPNTYARSYRNVILKEEAIRLGKYGVLTIIYPDDGV